MLPQLTSLGIALTVLYVPIWVAAGYLLFVRHGSPHMPWYFLFMFSMFRLASGILIIVYPYHTTNVGIIIASIITLNVGVIPLLLCTIGFLRIIHYLDLPNHSGFIKAIKLTRISFFVGIALLIAGGALAGQYTNLDFVRIGSILGKAGYVVIAVILAVMVVFEGWLWMRRSQLQRASNVCLIAITAAMPFQIVRIAYALLENFSAGDWRWQILAGAVGPFVGMVLLMELVVVVMYISTGFAIPRLGKHKDSMKDTSLDKNDNMTAS